MTPSQESDTYPLPGVLRRALQGRAAQLWLAILTFFNSFLIPVPAEALLLPLCVATPRLSWRYASIATVASVLGGLAGYAIGAFAFKFIGASIVDFYGTKEEFDALTAGFNNAGLEWILLATISPLPYKLVTVASGVSSMNLGLFICASLAGRLIGYFALAAACWFYGDRVRSFLASSPFKALSLALLLIAGYCLLLGNGAV